MLTLREILQPRTEERRAITRTLINRDISIHFAGCNGVYACRVRDVTNRGAGIFLNGLSVLPFEFDISFDNCRTMCKCRLTLRDGDFVGAAFES
jgi:hypothetical protein